MTFTVKVGLGSFNVIENSTIPEIIYMSVSRSL